MARAIDPYLNQIRTAIYGREVRSSIADGIEQCYDDAVEVVEVSDSQPTGENVKLWVKPLSDDYQVPTYAEHQALAGEVEDVKDLLQDVQAIVVTDEARAAAAEAQGYASDAQSQAVTARNYATLAATSSSSAGRYASNAQGYANGAASSAESAQQSSASASSSATAAQEYAEAAEDCVPSEQVVSGTDPVIVGTSNTRYVCGEVASISITPSSAGITDVVFTTGTTPAVLTVPASVNWPGWFDPDQLDASTTYELSILNGTYGVVALWT